MSSLIRIGIETVINHNGKIIIQDLFPYNFDTSTWSSNCGCTLENTCSGEQLVGGYSRFGMNHYATRTYSGLATHNSIILSIRLFFIDSWDTEELQIFIDDTLRYQEKWVVGQATMQLCGATWNDQIFDRELIPFKHTNASLKINITSNLNDVSIDESFGFSSIQIRLSTCDYTCYTCSGTASNNCLSCPLGTFLNPGNTCKSTCPINYIKDNTTGTCVKCYQYNPSYPNIQSCYDCMGQLSTNCISCNSGDFFDTGSGACMDPCPDQTYKDSTTGKCQPCYSPSTTPASKLACATCSGPSATSCLTCPQGTFLFIDGTCILNCPSDYYPASTTYPNNNCSKCYQNNSTTGPNGTCVTCNGSNSNNCLSCSATYYLDSTSNKCVTTCPTGYWNDSSSKTCKLCFQAVSATAYEQTCYTCTQPSSRNCTSCVAGAAYLYSPNGTCLITCPVGWWGDSPSKQCKQCYQYTSTAPTKNTCTTCNGTNSNNCLSCSSPLLLDPTTSTCVNTCPIGYWNDSISNKCALCYLAANPLTDINKSCKTCNGPASTNCLTCLSGNYYHMSNHSCLGRCPKGFFVDSTTFTCLKCYQTSDPTTTNRTCITCDGATSNSCLSCETSAFLLTSLKTCYSSCPNGYYGNTSNNTCMKCFQGSNTSEPCQTCLGPLSTDCISCYSGIYFLPSNRMCVLDCPVIGWYPGTNVCLSCYFPSNNNSERGCLTCNGGKSTDCLSCLRDTYYYPINSTCLLNCPFGYFKDNTTFTCLLCTNSSVNGCPTSGTSSLMGAIITGTNAVNILSSASSVFLLGGLTIPSIMSISFPADISIFIYLYVGFPDIYVQFTRGMLQKQKSLNPLSYIRGTSQIPKNSTIGMFGFWETSTVLFENSGIQIIKEILTLLVIAIFSILSFLFRNHPQTEKAMKKCRDIFRWNGLISFLLQDFSNLLLNSMIQMRENISQNTYAGVSMGAASVVVLTYAVLIPYIAYLLNRKKSSSKESSSQKQHNRVEIPKSMKTICEGFKDNFWISRNFTIIYVLQYVTVIFTVFFVQTLGYTAPALYTSVNVIYLVIILGCRPFKSKLKMGVIVFNQICKNIMGFLALALGANQATNAISQQTQSNIDIGIALIVLTLIGCTVDCIFSLVLLTITVFELLTTFTQRKKIEGLDLLESVQSLNASVREQEPFVTQASRNFDESRPRQKRKSSHSNSNLNPNPKPKPKATGLRPVYPGTRKFVHLNK